MLFFRHPVLLVVVVDEPKRTAKMFYECADERKRPLNRRNTTYVSQCSQSPRHPVSDCGCDFTVSTARDSGPRSRATYSMQEQPQADSLGANQLRVGVPGFASGTHDGCERQSAAQLADSDSAVPRPTATL